MKSCNNIRYRKILSNVLWIYYSWNETIGDVLSTARGLNSVLSASDYLSSNTNSPYLVQPLLSHHYHYEKATSMVHGPDSALTLT